MRKARIQRHSHGDRNKQDGNHTKKRPFLFLKRNNKMACAVILSFSSLPGALLSFRVVVDDVSVAARASLSHKGAEMGEERKGEA